MIHATPQTTESMVDLIQKLGFPIVAAGVSMFIVWKMTRDMARTHSDMVESLRKTNEKNSDALALMAQAHADISRTLLAINTLLRESPVTRPSRMAE